MHPPLETLRRQFFALVPPYLLRIPDSQVLASPESQQWLVDELIAANRLPEAGYRRVFWRKVLPVIERGINEGDEDAEVSWLGACAGWLVLVVVRLRCSSSLACAPVGLLVLDGFSCSYRTT